MMLILSFVVLTATFAINADRNGKVRIRGKNIEIQADEDIDITAGRNVNIKFWFGSCSLISGNTLEKGRSKRQPTGT